MSVGRLLDISVRTMSTYQSAIDVATNNISNAGNTDYTRQKVVLASEVAENGIGSGVKIQDVLRIRDDILDMQLRKYQSSFSDASKRSEILTKLETTIAEPSDNGLSNYFTEFFNSWDELTTNPNSLQLRLNVIQKSQQLSERLKEIMDGFTDVQYSIQKEAALKVDQINNYLKSIYELNQKVYDAKVRNANANELEDQRDALIDKLSKLVNISVQKSEYGAVLINVGGIYGADQTNYNQFEVGELNGQAQLVSKNDTNTGAIVNSGELNALFDLFSVKIPGYKTAYENIADSFIDKVNSLHLQGYTMITGGVSNTNIPFFGELDSNGKIVNAFVDGELKINSSILADPKNMAASSAAGNDGNSTIANSIANLRNQKFSDLNDQTFLESYNANLNSIGLEKVVSDNSIESGNMVIQNLETQKASNSGVSLDEEMANVLKYQRSYEASSKLIKIADELLQTILDLVQ